MKRESVGRLMKVTGVMNEGDKSSNTRITRTILTDSGIIWEGVGYRFLVDFSLDICIYVTRIFFEWRREDNFCAQSRIPLQLNCRMAPAVC